MASPTLLLLLTSPGLSPFALAGPLAHTCTLSLSLSHTHTHTRYYSERVRRLTYPWGCEFKHRANHANGTPLSDAAVREAADFGVFIE